MSDSLGDCRWPLCNTRWPPGIPVTIGNYPVLSVTVTGRSFDELLSLLNINLQISGCELAGLISLGNEHVDQFV